MEAVFREAEWKVRAVFDQTFQFIGLMTPQGILLEANRTALEFASVKESDVLGKPFWDTPWWTHSPELQARLRKAVTAAARGEFVRFEATHPSAGGELRYIDFSVKPVRDDDGNVVFLIPEGRDITERKQAEDALRRSEKKYRRLVENLKDEYFFYTHDRDGTFRFVSPSITNVLGYTQEEFLTHFTAHLTDSPLNREVIRHTRLSIEGKKQSPYEVEVFHKDGSIHRLEVTEVPVFDEQGKVALVEGIAHDITERVRAEQALRQSENTARALLNAPMDSAILLDRAGTILALNEPAARRLGKPSSECLGANMFDLLPPHGADLRRANFHQVLETGKPLRFEDEREGRFYDNNFYPILDREGTVQRIAIYARDVSDYREAVARLKDRTRELIESEEKYRTLVENLPLVVYRMGTDGRILFINHFAEELFGYSSSEIFRHPGLLTERIHESDRAEVEKLRLGSFREGKEFVAEYRVKHKDGHLIYVMDHAIPVPAGQGRVYSVNGIIMDVTGRVELAEKLVRAEGLRTIGEVSARLAHEIRNPLVSAGGFARRLLSSLPEDDPNRSKVEIIVKEVSRLEMILRMILNYIRPLELRMSPTDPNLLVERALNAVEDEIRERNVRLDLRLAPVPSSVSTDCPIMEQALKALIGNALNQMPEGSTLSFSAFQEGSTYKLSMHYPVEHMGADDVEHFFYPFAPSRVVYDANDLALSRIIIDKHGGGIEVTMKKPGELTIQISLPCLSDES